MQRKSGNDRNRGRNQGDSCIRLRRTAGLSRCDGSVGVRVGAAEVEQLRGTRGMVEVQPFEVIEGPVRVPRSRARRLDYVAVDFSAEGRPRSASLIIGSQVNIIQRKRTI